MFIQKNRHGLFRKFVVIAMRLTFLNNTLRNRRFNYSPMYYDEQKEKLKQKKEQYRRLEHNKMDTDERRELLRGNLRDEFSRAAYRKAQRSSSNTRILLLIGLLLALGYFIFNGVDQVDTIVENLWE